MSQANLHPLEVLLRLIAQADPHAWYPRRHAEQTDNKGQPDRFTQEKRPEERCRDRVHGHGQGDKGRRHR